MNTYPVQHGGTRWLLGASCASNTFVAALTLSLGAAASPLQTELALQAAQATAPVPPSAYQSAFAGLPTGVEDQSIEWRQANTNVGQFKRGYADLLQWEQAQAQKAASTTDGPKAVPPVGAKP